MIGSGHSTHLSNSRTIHICMHEISYLYCQTIIRDEIKDIVDFGNKNPVRPSEELLGFTIHNKAPQVYRHVTS